MTWGETFKRTAEHYARLAMTPGWWQYAQARVAELKQQQGGHWQGLRAEVGRRVKAARFRPAPGDLTAFVGMPSEIKQSTKHQGA